MTADPTINPEHPTPLVDLEAEQAALGGVLLDNRMLPGMQVHLAPADFYAERHQYIAEGMWSLGSKGEPIDILTLKRELESRGTLPRAGGTDYLAELSMATPAAVSTEHYAELVAETAWRRRLHHALGVALADIQRGVPREDVEATIDRARTATRVGRRRGLRRIRDLMSEARERVTASAAAGGIIGLPTGLRRLDGTLGGLRPGKLYVLAARPGLGKSSGGIQFALHVAGLGNRVAIFSAEMPDEEVADRMISIAAGIDGTTLLTRGLDEAVTWATGHLSGFPVWVDDTPRITMSAVATECRYLVSQGGLDLVVIDYAQLLRPDDRGQTRSEQVNEIGEAAKALAKELRVPVVLLSQLNRASENGGDGQGRPQKPRRPRLTDLREGGEQAADVVIFIWRGEDPQPRHDGRVDVELVVAKHRGGRTGLTQAVFSGPTFTFTED